MRKPAYGVHRGGALLIAIGAALWGTDAVLRVPLIDTMSSSAIVLAEHLLLLAYSVPILLWYRASFARLGAAQWATLILIGWGSSGLATVLFTAGFATGDPTTVILLQKMQPLFAITLARLMLREPFGRAYWLCFAVAIVGGYLVSFGSLEPIWKLSEAQLLTAVYAIGAALLWGAGTVFGRFVLADLPFPALTAARFFVALPFLAALAFVQGVAGQVAPGIIAEPLFLILLAVGPGLLSLLLYYRGLSGTPASVATLAELAFPGTAVVLNWLFLGRLVSPTQLVGFFLLWGAIVVLDRVVVAPERRAASPAPAV